MIYPYSFCMLIAGIFKPLQMKGTFWICSIVILCVACLPLCLGEMTGWINGLYDALVVILIFPSLVWIGASEIHIGKTVKHVSRFLGNLSYPLYAIHYPFMYLFYAHIGFSGDLVSINKLQDVWLEALLLPIGCVILACICYKYYDLPVRKWLSKHH